MKYKQLAVASATIAAFGVLAGCGIANNTTGSAPKSTLANKTNRTTSSVGNNDLLTSDSTNHANAIASTFPSLIQQGMQQIEGKTTIQLYAPTTYPGAVHTPLPVSVTANLTESPVPSYSVLFHRDHANIGGFTVSDWSSSSAASQHLLPSNTSLHIQPSVPSASTMNLGNGIQANVKKSPAKDKKVSALVWHEGRWIMEVLYPSSLEHEGVTVAKSIVQYCHANFLPVPDSTGYVLVSVASGNASTFVSWSKDGHVFDANSTGTWNSNLSGGYLSALEMAVSMKPYKG